MIFKRSVATTRGIWDLGPTMSVKDGIHHHEICGLMGKTKVEEELASFPHHRIMQLLYRSTNDDGEIGSVER
jgi:hypothetical protein